jgi:arabinofuranosyltransferase
MALNDKPCPPNSNRVEGDFSVRQHLVMESLHAEPRAIGGVWWLLAAVLILGVGLRIALSVRTDFTIGDAFIIFRFAEQFAAGNGLVFNAGEWVGGNTSPLHTLLLGFGACTGMDIPWVARVLGIACDIGTLFLMWNMIRGKGGIRSPSLQVAVLAMLFLCPFLFFYSVSGMETPLYMVLIFFVLDRTLRKLDWVWCLAVALVFFCRPDGVVAVGAALLFTLIVTRKIPWLALVGTFLIGLAYLGFNYFAYHSVIPPTVKVKAVAYHNSAAALFQYIADRFFFHRAWVLAAYIALMLTLLVIRRRRPTVLLLGLAAIGYLVFDLTAPYLRTWYVVPFLTLSACTILVATASLAEDAKLPHLSLATVGALAAYMLVSCLAYREVFKDCRAWRVRIHECTEAAGTWLKDNTPPDAKLFVTALEIGYFAKRRTWDAPGLVAPRVLQLIQSDPRMKLLEMADRVQADYAAIPNDEGSHPNFRQVKIFRTKTSPGHMGLAEGGYSIYERLNPAASPVSK